MGYNHNQNILISLRSNSNILILTGCRSMNYIAGSVSAFSHNNGSSTFDAPGYVKCLAN
jgi:hypothetical protein